MKQQNIADIRYDVHEQVKRFMFSSFYEIKCYIACDMSIHTELVGM